MTAPPDKRPFGLTAIIGLQLLNFLLALGTAFLIFGGALPDLPALVANGRNAFATITLVIDLLGIFIIYGLWRYKRWAWRFLMLQTGTNLLVLLLSYFAGRPQFLNMLVNVLIVFYLNQPELRESFIMPDQEGQLDERL